MFKFGVYVGVTGGLFIFGLRLGVCGCCMDCLPFDLTG